MMRIFWAYFRLWFYTKWHTVLVVLVAGAITSGILYICWDIAHQPWNTEEGQKQHQKYLQIIGEEKQECAAKGGELKDFRSGFGEKHEWTCIQVIK